MFPSARKGRPPRKKPPFVLRAHKPYNGPHHLGNGSFRLEIHLYEEGVSIVLSVRPKIAELVFKLYGRPLHPELFEVYQSRTVQRGDFQAKIDITSAGHVVTWRYAGLTLTEVATSAHQPLPTRRRLLSHRFQGERTDEVECRGGVTYQVAFQLEPIDAEVFWTFQEELARAGRRQGMLHQFHCSGRMALGALSYINVETRDRLLSIQAFHTFPDDCAIIKTQSLFRIPRPGGDSL